MFGPKLVGLFSGPVPEPGGLVQPCQGTAALGISPPKIPSWLEYEKLNNELAFSDEAPNRRSIWLLAPYPASYSP